MVDSFRLQEIVYSTARKAYGPFKSNEKEAEKALIIYTGALNMGVSTHIIMQAFYNGALDAVDDAKCVNNVARQIDIQ